MRDPLDELQIEAKKSILRLERCEKKLALLNYPSNNNKHDLYSRQSFYPLRKELTSRIRETVFGSRCERFNDTYANRFRYTVFNTRCERFDNHQDKFDLDRK